ncbi:MAG: molybdopterin-dependent oxidoreductase, partial [Bacteroidetes bacterium]|nr:molybdopterin-dependent oxidoreductase [Bacteroidota bacterium]
MPAASDTASMGRRRFLRRAGGLALGLGLVPLVGCEDNTVEPLAPGTEIPFLTPTEDYYVQHGGAVLSQEWGGVQQIARDDWTLTIDGLVETPLTLRFSDLEAMMDEAVTVLKTMRCITDSTAVPGLIGNALWTGIPLRRVLERAGVDRQRTRRLRLYGSDGFTNNLPLDRVFENPADDLFEPLLVFAMNGEPLTAEHGH